MLRSNRRALRVSTSTLLTGRSTLDSGNLAVDGTGSFSLGRRGRLEPGPVAGRYRAVLPAFRGLGPRPGPGCGPETLRWRGICRPMRIAASKSRSMRRFRCCTCRRDFESAEQRLSTWAPDINCQHIMDLGLCDSSAAGLHVHAGLRISRTGLGVEGGFQVLPSLDLDDVNGADGNTECRVRRSVPERLLHERAPARRPLQSPRF